MNINIFGSTGEIGTKTLLILKKYYPNISINFLIANNNSTKLLRQTKLHKPKYICLFNKKKIGNLRKSLKNFPVTVLDFEETIELLLKTKSTFTVLSISGIQSLLYLRAIFKNTKYLGLVNKECVVSAGHLLKKLNNKSLVNIFPLDSEHYSLYNAFSENNFNEFKLIYLTASGGPFLNKQNNQFFNATAKEAILHPKWKMGFKNSIDSATMANKCLEIIEAHYLFNVSYSKIKIIIHPEALIHSIIEFNNYTSIFNYFFHDMSIPIFNFLNTSKKCKFFPKILQYNLNNQTSLNFLPLSKKKFPIYKIFENLNKNSPTDLIKFNCANEFAVNAFENNKIKFGNIHKIVDKSLSIDLNTKVNSIEDIIEFQNEYKKLLENKYAFF